MKAYYLEYQIKGKPYPYPRGAHIDAKDLKSAKKKLEKKEKGRVEIINYDIVGYY